MDRRHEITQLLLDARTERGSWSRVVAVVYDELRQLADRHMDRERGQHTLTSTALVHEAYLRLMGTAPTGFENRRHFFGAAAEAMRRVLVDHARRVQAKKRGGDQERMSISLSELVEKADPDEFLALDSALNRLEAEDPRAAEITRLRFFAGMCVGDVARIVGVSERTVMREWAFARARLSELVREASR